MLAQILLVILIILAWIGARSLLQKRLGAPENGGDSGRGRSGTRRQERTDGRVEDMVRCAHCGVFLPRSEALADHRGNRYCSQEHRRRGPRDGA